MPFEFILPDLGEGITEGEVRKWVVKVGDAVEQHQTVLEIETDKAVVEVPSPRKGTILKINKAEGEVARVGEVLMVIDEAGEQAAVQPGVSRPAAAAPQAGMPEVSGYGEIVVEGAAAKEAPKVSDQVGTKEEEEKKKVPEERPKSVSVVGVLPEEETVEVLATPAVRAYAREKKVDLGSVKGTGPGGSITKDDVSRAARETAPAEDQYGPSERVAIKGIRRTIGRNLMASKNNTVSVTGMDEADVTELWDLREREKKTILERGIHLTFMPFFIKAVHHALAEHPMLNAAVDEEREEIIVKKYFNIGVAVDTPDGLMVPVIRDADKKTILELATDIQELSIKARDRKIKIEEMKGNSFTITNYGHFGTYFATPVINYPDVAILGTGRIVEKPWVKNGQIAIRRILPLSLTFDHRVTDGVDASVFISRVIRYLEDPTLLFLESA